MPSPEPQELLPAENLAGNPWRALCVLSLVLLEMSVAAACFHPRALRRLPDARGALRGSPAVWLLAMGYLAAVALQYAVRTAVGADDGAALQSLALAFGFVVACWRQTRLVTLFLAAGIGVTLAWSMLIAMQLVPLDDLATGVVPHVWHGLATFAAIDTLRRRARRPGSSSSSGTAS